MRPRLALIALLFAALGCAACPAGAGELAPSPALQTAQTHAPAECLCRAQGRMFSLGESACLRTAEGPRLAQCEMVLNNTSWRFTERSCPET